MKPHVLTAAALVGLWAIADPAVLIAGAGQGQARQRETMRFGAMDQNRDGVISKQEWRGSDRSFRAHDWNEDGILSGNEVRVGRNRDVQDEEDYDGTRRQEFRNWTVRGFRSLDHNGDDRIARSEWHYAPEAFIRADRNRDNILTQSEFLGNDTDIDREDRFEYLDANNDGRVERSEWHASRDAFEWLDRDNNGALSRTEVVGADEQAEQADLFASLDVDDDDAIALQEWHWSRRSFNRQDTNRDGRLTRSELTNAEVNSAQAANAGAIGTSGRTVVVESTERWVDTGLDVRAGDTISLQSSGTVTLSGNAADTARPGGAARRAPDAPVQNQPAGALIAKIGDSAPIFVGDRQTITATSVGRLYLGINDDHLLDNRGQFRVTLQRR
jgi:Ca2+-binding EF-hand superfamily protein